MNALMKIEPMALPDQRRPAAMPSLPEWVASRVAQLKEVHQPDETGQYRAMMTLPTSSILDRTQRQAVERNIAAIKPLLDQTPLKDPDFEAATLAILTKMMLALPSQRTGEVGAEATGEAYLAALDDLPSWAVQEAIRHWYRGDAVVLNPKQPHDFRWRPAPATLRSLTEIEEWRVRGRIGLLDRLLNARPLIEYTHEHCETMQKAMRGLHKALAAGSLTPEFTMADAVKLADAVPAPPEPAAAPIAHPEEAAA